MTSLPITKKVHRKRMWRRPKPGIPNSHLIKLSPMIKFTSSKEEWSKRLRLKVAMVLSGLKYVKAVVSGITANVAYSRVASSMILWMIMTSLWDQNKRLIILCLRLVLLLLFPAPLTGPIMTGHPAVTCIRSDCFNSYSSSSPFAQCVLLLFICLLLYVLLSYAHNLCSFMLMVA